MTQAKAPRQSCATGALIAILGGLIGLGWFMPTQAFAESVEHRIARIAPHFTVSRPDTEGPVPVVLMMHGCGGPRPFMDDMAAVAVEAGAAAVRIDSFAPRRISRVAAIATVCTGARLHGRERAGDLYAAFAWARGQDWVDPNRIIAMGWSHGGWTVMDALSLRGSEMRRFTGLSDLADEPLDGLAGAMLVYPYTGIGTYVGRRDWRITPRQSVAIMAEADYIVGDSRSALERQRARGAPLRILLFEGATHAFEDERAEDPRVRYNPLATQREHDLLREMIAGL